MSMSNVSFIYINLNDIIGTYFKPLEKEMKDYKPYDGISDTHCNIV